MKEQSKKYSFGKLSKAEQDSFGFDFQTKIQEAGSLAAAKAMEKLAGSSAKALKSSQVGSQEYKRLQVQLHAAQSMAQIEEQNPPVHIA